MSNALPILLAAARTATQPTTQPTTQPSAEISGMMTSLCGVGICVGLIWLVHCMLKPAKLSLSATPGRSNHLSVVHVVALFVVWQLTPAVLVIALGYDIEVPSPQTSVIAAIAGPLTILVGGLLIATYAFKGGAVRGMGFSGRRWINDSIRSVIGLIAVLPVCVGLLLATTWLLVQWRPELVVAHDFLKILTDPATPGFLRAMIVLAAIVLAPLGEEVFFRGLLQSMFRRYTGSPWIAVIAASVLFSAVHFSVIQSLPALFALSLVLGYNYERTGRLYSPIVIHMLFNATMIADTLRNA